MALPTPPPYSNPIPNNPFYYPESYIVQGAYSPLVVGTGLFVSQSGIISSTGGGGGAVSQIIGGSGILVSPGSGTGNVTVINAGVTALNAGPGINLSGSVGSITVNNTALGTVTSILAGTGLTATSNPITTSGTICLATVPGLTPGSYTNASITVDPTGRITSAASGTGIQTIGATLPISVTAGVNPVVSIADATTLVKGAVQLSDSTTSNSSTTAATSLAVCTAYAAATAAIPKACITALGDLITGTAASTPATLTVGADGEVLTACSTAPLGICWAPAGGGAVPATPTVEGIVFGCTDAVNNNYGLGDNIFSALTTGTLNIAVGAGALASTDTGVSNTAVGIGTLYSNTSGVQNVALGQQALFSVTTAGLNTAIGSQALQNTTGDANTALGNFAGNGITTGCSNIVIGNQSGGAGAGALTSGNNNVVIGNCIAVANGAGDCQLAIGVNTLCWLTGTSTGAIQPGAGIIDCAGSCGTAGQVLQSNGANAVCWGTVSAAEATPTTLGTLKGCTYNGAGPSPVAGCYVALGCNAAVARTTGSFNVAVGDGALCGATTSSLNIAIGNCALKSITTTNANIAIGYTALCSATTGALNVAIGNRALGANLTGASNVAIGTDAMRSATGCTSVAFGSSALCLNCGVLNSAVGHNAGKTLALACENALFGAFAGFSLDTGGCNTLIGACSGTSLVTGCCNVFIGECSDVGSDVNCCLSINVGTLSWLTGDSTGAIKPAHGIADCALSCGTANMVLTSQGNAVQWKTVSSAIALPNYGSFYDTTTQTSGATCTTPRPITLNCTDIANNFSITAGSRITGTVPGTYNLQFSAQLVKSNASQGEVEIYLAKGGIAVPYSNTRFTLAGNGEQTFAALNYLVQISNPATDYFQLYWASDHNDISIETAASLFGGPDTPGMIVTIVPVGA